MKSCVAYAYLGRWCIEYSRNGALMVEHYNYSLGNDANDEQTLCPFVGHSLVGVAQ